MMSAKEGDKAMAFTWVVAMLRNVNLAMVCSELLY